MKGRVIVRADHPDWGQVSALVVNGRLEDVLVGGGLMAGHILFARVTRKLPKSGAFCQLTDGTEGYLRDAKSVKAGDVVPVQVASIPEPGKAMPVTTRILFKGPRIILTPDAPGINVSKRIGNEAERARLTEIVTGALAQDPETAGFGAIIRTSARNEDEAFLTREVTILAEQVRMSKLTGADLPKVPLVVPGLFGDPITSSWLAPVPDEILVPKGTDEGSNHLWGDDRLAAALRPTPEPFDDLEEHFRGLTNPVMSLSGGASIAIEPTRALVAVDVNTGGDFSPAAGLKANLAAAKVLPRQLRLGGLGGQIAVDFAPMPKQHRKTLEEALKKAFRDDTIETSLVGWTGLGLYELQRKRERRPLKEVL